VKLERKFESCGQTIAQVDVLHHGDELDYRSLRQLGSEIWGLVPDSH
jgi:hypothetical protein